MKEILEIKNNDKYLISLIFVTLKKLKEKNFPQEITISSLNYIYKHYEEVVQNFYLEGKKRLNVIGTFIFRVMSSFLTTYSMILNMKFL